MATITQETRFALARRELVGISKARGQELRCESGELWITVDGDARDVILGAGESWRIDSDAAVTISAVAAATLTMRQSPTVRCRPWWSRAWPLPLPLPPAFFVSPIR